MVRKPRLTMRLAGNRGPRKPRKNGKAPSTNTTELQRYADRAERLEVERRQAGEALKEVLVEAADKGHHKKALMAIVKRRLESTEQQATRQEFENAFDDMLVRLGMLAGTELGDAAMAREQSQPHDQHTPF